MKMRTLAATFLAVAVAAVMGVAAQDQSPTQTPPGSDTPSTQAPAPAPAPEQPAPPDQSAPAAKAALTISGCVAHEGDAFQLTDAKPAGDTKADVDDEYTLVAAQGVNFAPHEGHQVEVTGTASPASAGGSPTLTVSALKMVAPKCP
jgi:hypothetical protein